MFLLLECLFSYQYLLLQGNKEKRGQVFQCNKTEPRVASNDHTILKTTQKTKP